MERVAVHSRPVADAWVGDGLTPQQAERRARVIRAALELGAEGGYDAVQMREVSARAGVALGTVYRYFVSKDHLLSAAMAEWTGDLRERLRRVPPRGGEPVDRLVEVFARACRALERQPRLTAALISALAGSDDGVHRNAGEVRGQIAAMASGILEPLEPDVRAGITSILGHVWYSTLVAWVNGRREFSHVTNELERAIRLLLAPYALELRVADEDRTASRS